VNSVNKPDTKRRHAAAYGWRAKLGVIVPPTNTVNEAEWRIMAPDGVTIHATRMKLHADTTSPQGKQALYDDVETATRDLAQARLDAIAYGCTAGSMVLPLSQLSDFMGQVSGIACVTTAAAIVHAFNALEVSKIAVATPYHDALNDHEMAFLRSVSLVPLTISGLGIGAGGAQEYIQIAQTPADTIMDHVISADHPNADAMLVSCTDLPVLAHIQTLEDRLGKPVITSNQATFWATLRAAGVDDRFEDYGTLLAQH
jgi:maleate isomerase/arylmalonate decarboxylase